MHASCSSQWPLNQHMCITVSRHGKCFRDGCPCVTKCEQCEKDGKAYVRWKSLRMWSQFQTAPNVRIWSFFKTVRHFFFLCFAGHGSSLSYSSFSMWTSRGCGCIYFLCLCFCFRASLLTLSSLFAWQFWHRNNETASAATAENHKLM